MFKGHGSPLTSQLLLLSSSPAWGPCIMLPPWFPDGNRDFGDIAMRQWNKCINLHYIIFLILTHMCMCMHVRVMCESQFLHPQKGNTNPFLLFSLGIKRPEREHAIQSFGIVDAWGPAPLSHIYLEKRSNSGCSQSWAVQGYK